LSLTLAPNERFVGWYNTCKSNAQFNIIAWRTGE